MFLLGLTGSIGMGKSATSAMFCARGIPVYDADAVVHALYRGAAVPLIDAAFPNCLAIDGSVDRMRLGERVLNDPNALKRLEGIVHPLVGAARNEFITQAERHGTSLVVLDVPLLFETGGEGGVDAIALVSAPETVQKERVCGRPGMTPERFAAIVAKQLPDSEKRLRSHFSIDTSRGFAAAERQVAGILRAISGATGRRRNWGENARDCSRYGDDGIGSGERS